MSYASDKLYNGYLRKNLGRIVSTVRPREIIVHLPCLTEHDRESIEAKNDYSGSFEAMKLLLSCMKRRENWPEQFISALEECEHMMLAAEIRAEYHRLRGNNSPPPPASPASSVVTAHVHPAPSAPHLPDPRPAANAPPTLPTPSARDVPPEGPETNPIQETESHSQSTPAPAAPVVEVVMPPEPPQVQPEPPTQAVLAPPVTPPVTPPVAHPVTPPVTPPEAPPVTPPVAPPVTPPLAHASAPPPEQVDVVPRQEPEENLEQDMVQDVPQTVNIPEEVEEEAEVPPAPEPQEEPCENEESVLTLVDLPPPDLSPAVNDNTTIIDIDNKPIVAEPEPEPEPEPVPVLMEVLTPSTTTVEEDSFTTTTIDSSIAPPVTVEEPSAESASPLTNLDDLIMTPEKPPVQETIPQEEKTPLVVPELEETPEPETTKVVEVAEIVQETEAPPSSPPEVENGDSDQGSLSESEEEDMCFSKPGVLMSVEPPDEHSTVFITDSAPYSGDSGRLAISEAKKSAQSSLENGVGHKEPDKEVSESPASSLEEEAVEEDVVNVAEEPSILNKDIQAALPEDSGEPVIEVTTNVELEPEISLISDQSCCSSNALDVSESPAPSVDVEEVEENLNHVVEQPSISISINQDNQAPLIEDTEEQAIEIAIPDPTVIPDISSYPNEEGISESPAPSLDMEDVRENIGHVAEEPSILNLDVQTPLQQVNGEPAEIFDIASFTKAEHEAAKNPNQEVQTPIIQVNGEPAKEIITPVPPKPTPATDDNHQPNETPLDQKPGNPTTNCLNARYMLTAAGVGACALLIAWRLKH